MAELQARLKPRVCGYAGVKPALSDLQLGEIVLNTADAVFYTRHVDDTIKAIGAGLINLDDLQDVDTSTAAPTDKQVLSWSAADSLWTPRTISYNDLSDQPTIPPEVEPGISKIQDAEDFSLNVDPTVGFRYLFTGNDADGLPPAGEAEPFSSSGYGPNTIAFSTTDLDGVDRTTELYALTQGDPIRLLDEQGAVLADTVLGSLPTNQNNNKLTINFAGGVTMPPADTVVVFDVNGGQRVYIPLAQNDFISWNQGEQVFTPTQLADVATSGDYNDLANLPTIPPEVEPGISRIQDADDFEPNLAPFDNRTYSTDSSVPDANGEFGTGFVTVIGGGAQASIAIFYQNDDNGDSIASLFTTGGYTNGDDVYVSSDGGSTWVTYATTAAGPVDGFPPNNWGVKSSSLYAAIQGFSSVMISVVNPSMVDYAALADGDILKFDSASSKFRPAQLEPGFSGDYGDLTNTPDLSLKADLVGGKVPADQLPAIAVSEFLGTVADEAAMLALTGQSGDWCVRVDTDSAWILSADDASVLANWIELGGGAGNVVSVNDKTGAVSLGIQDMDDFALNQVPAASYRYNTVDNAPGTGLCWLRFDNYWSVNLHPVDADGNDNETALRDKIDSTGSGPSSLWWSEDNINWTEYPYSSSGFLVSGSDVRGVFRRASGQNAPALPTVGQPSYWSLTDPALLADVDLAEDDILQWDDVASKFKPQQLATVATSGDYNDLTNKPTITDAPVDSVNEQTGVVSLGIQDMDDFDLYKAPPTSYSFNFNSGSTTPGTGEWTRKGVNSAGAFPAPVLSHTDAEGQAVPLPANNTTQACWWSSDNGLTWVQAAGDNFWTSVSGGSRCYMTNPPPFNDSYTLLISFQDPASTVDVELADGDHLQWSEVNQAFMPQQLATVATSGSYNDLEDLPSEVAPGISRIQDADDFALNQTSPPSEGALFRTNTGASNTIGNNGDLFPFSNDVYISQRLADGTDQSAVLPAAGSGAGNISIIVDGTTYTAAYSDVIGWPSGADPDWVRFLGANAGDLQTALNASVGSTVEVLPIDFVSEDIPLAQGDVLSWDVGREAFTPQQLNLPASYVTSLDDLDDVDTTTAAPTDKQVLAWNESQLRWMPQTDPAAPVQSVQDKTGDVRLTIQEMDDFRLATSDLVMTWNRGSQGTPGEWSSNGALYWHVNHFDTDGVDQKQALIDHKQGGGSFWISTNNDPFLVANVQLVANITNYVQLNVQNHADFTHAGPLRISFVDPGTGEIPLANDDVLFWNADATKFIPRQLSYNDLADQPVIPSTYVESINNLDGVVTFGMNDLHDVVSTYTPDNRYRWNSLADGSPDNRAPKAAGQWGYFDGGDQNRQLRLNIVDAEGFDLESAMTLAESSGVLYVSPDDVTFTALPYRAKSHNTTDGYFSFFVDPYMPPKADGPLYVSVRPPETPEFQPFEQGSHLEFTGTLWQPVQLAPVAKSGSYDDLDDQPFIPAPVARITEQFTASELLAGITYYGALSNAGNAGMFISVTTDHPAWVRFYTDTNAQTDDAERLITENPERGAGVLLEVITDGTSTYKITPSVHYFSTEDPLKNRLLFGVTNIDPTETFDITLSVVLLPLEP